MNKILSDESYLDKQKIFKILEKTELFEILDNFIEKYCDTNKFIID